jgi:hypothetical protein
MNATVPQDVINEAMEADPARAAAEYGAEFRTDVESFVSREVVESCVVSGRHELARVAGTSYSAFVDPRRQHDAGDRAPERQRRDC